MVAFLKTISFNKSDFISPPLPAIDIRTGREIRAYDQELQQEDCRITPVSEGEHFLIVGLRRAREGDIRVVFSLHAGSFSLIAREEIPLPVLVAEYDAVLPARQFVAEDRGLEDGAPPPRLAQTEAEQIRTRITPLVQKKIRKWMRSDSPEVFKSVCSGLVNFIWDLRQAKEKRLRLQIKETDSQRNPFGGKHRAYHDSRSS